MEEEEEEEWAVEAAAAAAAVDDARAVRRERVDVVVADDDDAAVVTGSAVDACTGAPTNAAVALALPKADEWKGIDGDVWDGERAWKVPEAIATCLPELRVCMPVDSDEPCCCCCIVES